MANKEQLKILRQGVGTWNSWRAKHPQEAIDLRGVTLRKADLREADLNRADLNRADFSGANLSQANLTGADFFWANLSKVNLNRTNLNQADFNRANLKQANFTGATLGLVNFRWADLSRANLSLTNLITVDFTMTFFGDADLRGADLGGKNLLRANLSGVNLSGAKLSRANLSGANLSGTDLMRTDCRNTHFSDANLSHADLSEANLSRAKLRGADLKGAHLRGADLRGADLLRADLSGADLSGANLSEINFSRSFLRGVGLRGSVLKGAYFRGANLSALDLSGADLKSIDLQRASLIGANLNGATITDACLWEIQRAGWSIQGIICEAAYWDENRHERTLYSPGEFEQLYADKTKIVLHYEGGISPIEVATLPALIQRIEATHPGCVLRLQSIQEAPGGATVTLIVEEGGGRNPAEIAAMKAELEEQGRRLLSAERRALEEESQRLQVEHTLRYLSHEVFPRLLESGRPKYSISITGGEQTMGDTYIAGQVGAQGPRAHVHDINFNQLWSQSGQSLDLQALATQLATLRQHLRQEAVEPEHDAAIGAVANAEMAAKEGNGPKTFEFLSKAGQWTLDNAAKIGVGVATAALKTALGL